MRCVHLLLLTPVLVVSACGSPSAPDTTPTVEPIAVSSPAILPEPAETPVPSWPGGDLIRQTWSVADNRTQCAAIGFTDDAGANGTPRVANFSGGWGVAFDLPDRRSAYGVAGPGLIPIDDQLPYAQTRRLMRQWPHFRNLALTGPSFAGYGLNGAKPYRADNPGGEGDHSVAYVRIDGQTCTYNVWSRISRAHLEALLDRLRILPNE